MSRKAVTTIGVCLLLAGVIAFGLAPGFLIPAHGGHDSQWARVAIRVYWVSGLLGLLVGFGLAALLFALTNPGINGTDNKLLHSTPR